MVHLLMETSLSGEMSHVLAWGISSEDSRVYLCSLLTSHGLPIGVYVTTIPETCIKSLICLCKGFLFQPHKNNLALMRTVCAGEFKGLDLAVGKVFFTQAW